MESLGNLDLFSVGVAIAGIGVLGCMVFLNNRKSVTNWTFLLLAISVIIWSSANYLFYKFTSPDTSLIFLRLEICSAVWFAFFVFELAYVFPREQVKFPRYHLFVLIPIAVAVSLVALTPFIFPEISGVSATGIPISQPNPAGIILFGLTVMAFNLSGLVLIIKKMLASTGIERTQFRMVLMGLIIMLVLIIAFNFILPAFFDIQKFVPLAAVFIFPFIAFTAYAIFKHHLLNVKVISTEILAFLLVVVTFSEIVIAQSLVEVLFRVGEFILVSIIGIFLIQSVLREVQQREELERLNKQIEDQNQQLQELSRFKSQLLSLASHQIKSPLAAIKGFVSLILDGSYGSTDDRVKETLKKVQGSADDLIGLINTLLDVRKVEEGKMEYKFEKVDLRDMITKMVDLLQPLATNKHLELSFAGGDQPILVNADPEKLKQVVQNLIDNAIKYTPSGFVKAELKKEDKNITISVSDSGLGIAPELIPHLFEEFVRDERVKQKILGTGLGLYIARKIVEAHGGKIWATSEGEGKGSMFNVTLPLAV